MIDTRENMKSHATFNFFLDRLNLVTKESLLFLKKQSTDKLPLFMNDGKISRLSPEEFFNIFEVEYLPNLLFEDLKILKKVIKSCKRQIKLGNIAEREIWAGTFYEEEIKKFSIPKVYIKWIDERKGFGLFALTDLKKDTFIGEYSGLVKKFKSRIDSKNSYCFEYQIGSRRNSHFTIDAKYMGNHVRFINHSYSPNLSTFAALVGQIIHIVMKTSKSVAKDTELTYDYGPRYWKKREEPI